jgi:hypothetical protein
MDDSHNDQNAEFALKFLHHAYALNASLNDDEEYPPNYSLYRQLVITNLDGLEKYHL